MSLTGSKRLFTWKKAYAIIFAKFQVISSHFDKLPYFTPDFPTNQIMDWDLDNGEILNTYKNEFELLKTIFFVKEGIRNHFWKVSSDLKPFWQVTYFTPDFPTNQIIHWDLDKGEIIKTSKNEFDWLKTIFYMKEGIRDHFCKVSSDLKQFWQVTIFHTRLPHKPNHGLGLRQGWNSENLQKWVWIAQNDIFQERRHTRSFLQSFKWLKAILTSYHISPQTSPQTKSWVWT